MQNQLISEVPEWIPQEAWEGWLVMRKQKRIPTTDRAKRMAITTLDMLRGKGENVEFVLNQSEFNGWAGLFPVSEQYYQMLGIDRTRAKANAVVVQMSDRRWAE